MREHTASSRGAPDYVLLLCFAALLVFGLIMLTSASAPAGYSRFGDRYFFVKRQIAFGVIPGIIAFFLCTKLDYHLIKKWSMPIFLVSIVFLLAVFVPGVGSRLNTADRSWIQAGAFTFQPAEIAKFALIIFLASYLADKGRELLDFQRGFLVALGLGSIPIFLLLFQPDVGTAIIVFAIVFGLLATAGANPWHLSALAGAGCVAFALLIAFAPYRAARVMTFLHPELDPKGVGYQINQASLALGSGGWFGLGLGHSRQKFQYLPEVEADSIFAIMGEEMGFFVTAGFIALLLFVCVRSLRIAMHATDDTGKLLVSGIVIWFMVQSFVNIAGIAGLLPFTGVPLPFVSHGGTALAMAMAGVGILVNVSKQTAVARTLLYAPHTT